MRYPQAGNAHVVAEIDLSALRHNFQQVKKCIAPRCQVLAVVKANAYGHGAIPVSRALVSCGVSMLGVAWVHEGIELRQAGIRVPILIMAGATPEQADEVVEHGLTPVIYLPEQVMALQSRARRSHRKVRVHIKIDSGMGRLGVFTAREASDLAESLRRATHLVVEGVMTHMAEDGPEQRSFTLKQLEVFRQRLDFFSKEGINPTLKHTANSSLTIDLKAAHFDLVRPGIMLYGYPPSNSLSQSVNLKPVMMLKTRILHLKRVPAGCSISYGKTYVTRRESVIATLPVGYADGIPRSLSNQGEVLVRDRRIPVVGRVCMDMTMLDATAMEDVGVGDEVVLIGRQGAASITAEEIARKTGTIAYEILCGIGPRVARSYKKPNRSKK